METVKPLLRELKEEELGSFGSFVSCLQMIERWQDREGQSILLDGTRESVFEHTIGVIGLFRQFILQCRGLVSQNEQIEIENRIWVNDFPECIDGDLVLTEQNLSLSYQNDKQCKEAQNLDLALRKYLKPKVWGLIKETYLRSINPSDPKNKCWEYFDSLQGNYFILNHRYRLRQSETDRYLFQTYGLNRIFNSFHQYYRVLPDEYQPYLLSNFSAYLNGCRECGYQENLLAYFHDGSIRENGLTPETIREIMVLSNNQ